MGQEDIKFLTYQGNTCGVVVVVQEDIKILTYLQGNTCGVVVVVLETSTTVRGDMTGEQPDRGVGDTRL